VLSDVTKAILVLSDVTKTILVLSGVTKTILVLSGVTTWEAAERFLPPSRIVDRWLAWSTGLA
jgi:hypothetical protein